MVWRFWQNLDYSRSIEFWNIVRCKLEKGKTIKSFPLAAKLQIQDSRKRQSVTKKSGEQLRRGASMLGLEKPFVNHLSSNPKFKRNRAPPLQHYRGHNYSIFSSMIDCHDPAESSGVLCSLSRDDSGKLHSLTNSITHTTWSSGRYRGTGD